MSRKTTILAAEDDAAIARGVRVKNIREPFMVYSVTP